jgi:Flp pilus assembly protein TadD
LSADRERRADAISAFRGALRLTYAEAPSTSNIGTILAQMGKTEEAERLFRKAIEMDAGDPDYPCRLGDLLRVGKQWEAAHQAYEQSLAIDAEYGYPVNGLALLHHARGEVDEAERLFRKAMELEPKEPLYPCNLGHLLRERRQWEAARQAYERSLAIDAEYGYAVNGLGLLHQVRGEAKQAEELFRKAMESKAKDPVYPFNLGHLLR